MGARGSFDELVELKRGQEYHRELSLNKGETVTFTCSSTVPFYCGLFDYAQYDVLRNAGGPGVFGFEPTQQRREFSGSFVIQKAGSFYLVLRRGKLSLEDEVHCVVTVATAKQASRKGSRKSEAVGE